jgi:hypothetical protein
MIDITSMIDIIRISIDVYSCWITKIKIGVDEHSILPLLLDKQPNSSHYAPLLFSLAGRFCFYFCGPCSWFLASCFGLSNFFAAPAYLEHFCTTYGAYP